MEKDFDFTLLESTLGPELLAAFENETGIAPSPAVPLFEHVADTLERTGIQWLKASPTRSVAMLVEHMWRPACELALMPEDEASHYAEFEEEIHEALGLSDGTFIDSLFPSALVELARALAALDGEWALTHAFSAERLLGVIIGSTFENADSAASTQALRALGKAGAEARHRENRDMKAEALRHFLENRSSFASKDEAAQLISQKIVPAKFGTVRKWLIERKES